MLLDTTWSQFLNEETSQHYFIKLESFIKEESSTQTIFPKYEDIFRAFNLLSPDKVKVVIIRQDPYHGEEQANGLAFSVKSSMKIPPSLKNIYKELCSDLDCPTPNNGDLTQWAQEGVLLMNTVLTVRKAEANSHKNRGWELFTDKVIELLSQKYTHLVFILWGGPSQKRAAH